MGGLHGRGGRGCGGIPCHHENLGPLGVPGSRMPVQPPGARTSGSLPRARPNLGLHAYLHPAHALQLCIEHGCKGDNMSSLSTAVLDWYSCTLCHEYARGVSLIGHRCRSVRLSPSTLGRPAPEGLRYRKFASARTCRAPVNTHTDNTHAGMPCRARCWRALGRDPNP